MEEGQSIPPALNQALGGLPKSLVPATLKALDRLIGGAVDIPAAWLAQKKAKIEAQTEAYKAVETAIAKAAASEVGANPEIISRAVEVLVRKSYREQRNREAVAKATVEELESKRSEPQASDSPPTEEPDEEWLNVFEQYAERASTERMQRLWGRVLAGEIRRPGRYSMRTLRFLSEFSQQDALRFAELALSAFSDAVPKKLARKDDQSDIRPLIDMEAAGLISGASGLGLTRTYRFNNEGFAFTREDNLVLMLRSEPGATITQDIIALTPLGQELLSLVANRDPLECARRFGDSVRQPTIKWAAVGVLHGGQAHPFLVLWDEQSQMESTEA